ncbi:hypothetical protein [Microbacterium paraoxydans]|uniref:DUF2971 domain-containing protein n=1 Tax=Microbacterium paraoxydans TaxID=199592 RepID=A0A1H1UWF4_9MICO|nr:hypothetical protein [Microbacterium paraoxydans]SDS76904.1 hypothetical protein SAMN04489809_2633 [Microbacterium paraoxydans]
MNRDEAQARVVTEGALVWHYTSLDTVNRILENNYLLATEVSFQNDIRETVTADDAFKEALDVLSADPSFSRFVGSTRQLLGDLENGMHLGGSLDGALVDNARFILCSSGDPDSLYAWRTYGTSGAIGCAIGLDPAVPLGVVVDPTHAAGGYPVRGWTEVIYSPETVAQIAEAELITLGNSWNLEMSGEDEQAAASAFNLLITHLEMARSRVRAVAKDPSFADERERRVTMEGIGRVSPMPLTFTPSSMGPRPHVRLATAPTWGSVVPGAHSAPRLPIRAIKLGPDAPEIAEVSAQWMLRANGYYLDGIPVRSGWPDDWEHTVIVARSRHPYRSR